jgi:hypothetical protein
MLWIATGALAEARARNAAAKKQLDEKEKQENIKKARFDKASAVFSIILSTAKAIVADLGQPWKIAFDAAIGAAQLAVAVAQPLPKYFRGKNVDKLDSYEGYAYVNDGGKKEAIIRKDGSIELPQKMNTIEWVGKDDIVVPDANMLAWKSTKTAADMKYQITVTNENEAIISSLNRGFGNVVKTIKSQPGGQKGINVNDMLLKAWVKSDLPWRDFLKR